MRTRELSHLAQTATDPTVGFENIVQQAQIQVEISHRDAAQSLRPGFHFTNPLRLL